MSYRIVVVGYSEMMAAVIGGAEDAGCQVVGALRSEAIQYNPFFLKCKDYLNPSKDCSYLRNKKIYEIKAQSINSEDFKREFLKLNADILLIASWGEKLKKEIIMLPKIACINTHPSLLPKYRGPNPYMQVILHNERETGVTFHLVDESYDSGEILAQAKVPILQTDTGKVLKARCCIAARKLLSELLIEMQNQIISTTKQNEEDATYFPQITAKDILINFSDTSQNIDARIRAISDWQPCYFKHKNFFFKIKKHSLITGEVQGVLPGTIVEKRGSQITVVCGDSSLIKIEEYELYANFSKLKTPYYQMFLLNRGEILC